MENETRNCQNCKNDFIIEPDDFSFYEKMGVPAPTWCPECRMMRRMAWKNERKLYHRACEKCKNKIISIYSENKPFPVYCSECWWGDEWDPVDYGIDYNESKDFFVQFSELSNKIPHLAIPNFKNVKCDYTSWLDESKNCYMAFGSSRCEDVLYSETLQDCKNSLDLTNCDSLEYSYNCVYCLNSNNLQGCLYCDNCIECYFSYDLKSCNNCFLSYNLRHKNYMVLNEQYSKEEWLEKINNILGDRNLLTEAYKNFKELIKDKAIHRYANINKCNNVTGDNLNESQNLNKCFDSKRLKDNSYVSYGGYVEDCFDAYGIMRNSNLCYEVFSVTSSYKILCTISSWGDNMNIEYSQFIMGSNNLFGCHSLKKKSYCVLNKEYSKEEYEKLKSKIINEMKKDGLYGQFFPVELSPFGYNETVASTFFPISKEKALSIGYKWQDEVGGIYDKGTIEPRNIPNTVSETHNLILKDILTCINCKKNYKIIEMELDLYIKMNIPIPLKCIDCRYNDRLELCNPRRLWHRSCMSPGCLNEFETSYSPERSEIVYCEQCYQNELI